MKITKYELLIMLSLLISNMLMAQKNPYILKVDEYVPAPGQFINTLPIYEEGDDAKTMAEKCTEALANNARGMVSLGGWGGYITFHFDHPVVNVPFERDIYITGNAIVGSSEAGIVMVSKDENGNGLPDDMWYELSGSADTDSTNVIYGYELRYSKPEGLQDVPWTDNQGETGFVYRNSFHNQDYYPLWIDESKLFIGTRLPNNAKNTVQNGQNWVLDSYAYGYVDNKPNIDTLSNSFDIGWAVDPITRMPASLKQIDFVRVYTALNQSAGWLGETSTELTGAMDLHPDAEVAIKTIHSEKTTIKSFDLWGRAHLSGQFLIIKQ